MEVEVWNDGPTDHQENFEGKLVEIPRGKFIKMGRAKAVKFIGQFRPFRKDGPFNSQGIKMLRLAEDPEVKAARLDQPFKFFSSDNQKFRTKEGLKIHESQLTVGPIMTDSSGVKSSARKKS